MPQLASAQDIKKLGTIIGVWAHPDDESFAAAGIMSVAASQGQNVACITATKGELGIQDEQKWPADKLADIRDHELLQMLKILGCSRHHWLGYRDGSCPDVPLDEAVEKLSEIIQKIRPDTILTFGPDGWTGHPDHSTVSGWVKEAASKMDRPITVYHVVHTPEHYEKYFRPADEILDIFFNIDMPPLYPRDRCDIYFELPNDTLNKKIQALKVCESQTGPLFKLFKEQFLKEALGTEAFIIAKK